MKHILFAEAAAYPIILLFKSSALLKTPIINEYIKPLEARGIDQNMCVCFDLEYNEAGKAPTSLIKGYLENLLAATTHIQGKYLYVTDAAYFKVLVGHPKADIFIGYCLPCVIKGYQHLKVIYGINYQQVIFNSALQGSLNRSLDTLVSVVNNTYTDPGKSIIHSAHYPEGSQEIAGELLRLHQYRSLSCDIETFSLAFQEAGIGTIAFAWDKHNGVAFACDYTGRNQEVRGLLREFFEHYQGTLIWHNANYDVKVLIYTLWMEHDLDTKGLLKGLEIMASKFEDTKIITYLATNSTARIKLNLKTLAQEFAGNWAQDDIKDIRKISLPQLLQYNLVDCFSTWFVFDKYYPVMEEDKQKDLYYSLMLPSAKLIIQMELTGMPLDGQEVNKLEQELSQLQDSYLDVFKTHPLIARVNTVIQVAAMNVANAKLKTKQHPLSKFASLVFNPNSGAHIGELLYVQMGLPILDTTDTGLPATGADTLEKLLNHTENTDYKQLITTLIEYSKIAKILSSFIPAFNKGTVKTNGRKYLHGSFNIGGTVSGRLSSSSPNLQNVPANSTYGKSIKKCFKAPKKWLMVGADFNSLEDYVSALTTRDSNKLAVYEKGFDGHCLRAAYYFKELMPDIRLANEQDECYALTRDGVTTYHIKGDIVLIDGEEIEVSSLIGKP